MLTDPAPFQLPWLISTLGPGFRADSTVSCSGGSGSCATTGPLAKAMAAGRTPPPRVVTSHLTAAPAAAGPRRLERRLPTERSGVAAADGSDRVSASALDMLVAFSLRTDRPR